jgi:hypothetical protein
MTTANISTRQQDHAMTESRFVNDRAHGNSKEVGREKTIETFPQSDTWKIVAAGTIVPLGLATAAAVTTCVTSNERVAMTAWIAVAVVGTAAVIADAVVSHRRIVSFDRTDVHEKMRPNDSTTQKAIDS